MRHAFAHPHLHPAHREPKVCCELLLGQPRLGTWTKRETKNGCAHGHHLCRVRLSNLTAPLFNPVLCVLEIDSAPSRSARDTVTFSLLASSSRVAFSSAVNQTVTSFMGLLAPASCMVLRPPFESRCSSYRARVGRSYRTATTSNVATQRGLRRDRQQQRWNPRTSSRRTSTPAAAEAPREAAS